MECPLCNNSNTSKFHTSPERDYLICPRCSLIFVSPEFFITKNKEVGRYLEHENNLESEGYVDMFNKKIDVIAEFCSGAKTVLDFGCGYEPVLKTLLSRAGYEAKGYDINFFPDEGLNSTYDLVISTETFEHFKEPGKELGKIKTLLSGDGYLAVMTRHYPLLDGKADLESFTSWYYQRDPTHICFYSTKTFEWIAKSNGYKLLYDNGKDFIILQVLS
ncbi:MAG: class I SAM-dependent methyltransferase [Nitrospinales bacterium]